MMTTGSHTPSSPARPSASGWRTAAALLAALAILSVIAIDPPNTKEDAAATTSDQQIDPLVEDTVPGETGTVEGDTTGTTVAGAGTPGAPGSPNKPGSTTKTGAGPSGPTGGTKYECKGGANGGNTAKGVTGNRINLAATNVRSGTGASFLGTSYIGMQAVVNRVNAAGGICGRLLNLRLVDDGWVAATGATFLGNFAKGDYFALPVVPSSEGLTEAIRNKTISGTPIPVVGSDGMLKEQYRDPWVWPVATSTVSTMRIMTKHAFDKGARTFGIVYDNEYKFGKEGAAAYKEYVKSLIGRDPHAFVPLTPKQGNYSPQAQQFNESCPAGGCDFVAMLLTPETAATYIASQPERDGKKQGFGKMLTGGAQPLFNERFARDCKKACEDMLVWTGYNPPIGRLASEPDVAAYVDDVRSIDPGIDVNNQFLQGAYLGMKVFVAALQKVGPNLTRDAMRDAMNSMTYQSSLASPLSWTADKRFANQAAQPFRIVVASGDFAGFAEVGTGFLPDPQPGVVPE